MVYLDYSATTPVNDEVLNSFVEASKKYIGNPNSLHKLGLDSKHVIDAATKQIADILHVKEEEIIYTSGASESNNTAIKGVAFRYKNRGKHIISTELEHSSIIGPLNYLVSLGYEVDFVNLDKNGQVDLEDLKSKMRDDTILVSIGSVNSEIGIRQPLKEISKIVRQYPKCILHSDMTQSIGKEKVDLSLVDMASLSGQKFYGMKGVGILYKKDKLAIDSLIHGGKSTTIYRSGTPATSLIVSMAKALRLSYENMDADLTYVKELSDYLKSEISKYENVVINSNDYSIDQIVKEGIQAKLSLTPENARVKVKQALTKLVNKGSGNLYTLVI